MSSFVTGKQCRRILHVIETLQVGGTETQAVEIARRQRAMGNAVTVACMRAEGPLLTLLQTAGIPVIEFRKGRRLLSLRGVWQLFRLILLLRRGRFDVLHCHDLMANLFGVPAGILAATPVVISSRRYLDLEWWSGKLRNRVTGWIYNSSTYVLVNSEAARNLLTRRDGVPFWKVHLLHNGVDTDRFCNANKDSALASLRNKSMIVAVLANMYSPVKGHANLIAAAVEVCRAFPSTVFALIGDGQERQNLEQQVRDAGLENNILFLGSRRDIPELLACCDISVLPSQSEGFPNAVLEAMAAGLAIVATAVGGVPEIIEDEITGLLVPPANPGALAAAILRLLRDRQLRYRLSEAGRDHVVRHFSFEQLISSVESLYGGSQEPSSVRVERFPAPHTVSGKASFVGQRSE